MTVDRTNLNPADFRPEPLPAEFEADVAEVDRLLTRALHTSAPSGLSQRVYEMSVRDLRSGASPSLRLADADIGVPASRRMVFTRSSWARLALAAAVLLAAGVALWQPWSPSVTPNIAGNGAGNGGGNGGSTVALASVDLSDLDELADNNPSDLAAFEGQWSFILDAAELGSIDDLNHDLTLLVQQLEM